MKKEEYKKYAEGRAQKSHLMKDCVWAFLVGGAICTIGQGFRNLFELLKMKEEAIVALVPIVMIFLGAFFTAIGLYDNLAKYAGAGSLIPITGFSNSIASPAIEFKSEGLIMGVGAKMFIIAGPVLVYGILTSTLYGLIYFFAR